MNDAELWGTAEGFSKYLVSNRGRVKVVKTGKLIKQQPYPKRYMSVNIVSDDGKHRWWLVHRPVCTVFSGPCPPGLQARHLDGNPRNNRAENIKWGTASENSLDKYRHGTILRGLGGRPLTLMSIVRRFARLKELTGVEVTSYCFRHTYATRLLSNGVPDTQVAAMMGHSSTRMIHAHYSHVAQNSRLLGEIADRFG